VVGSSRGGGGSVIPFCELGGEFEVISLSYMSFGRSSAVEVGVLVVYDK